MQSAVSIHYWLVLESVKLTFRCKGYLGDELALVRVLPYGRYVLVLLIAACHLSSQAVKMQANIQSAHFFFLVLHCVHFLLVCSV